MRSHNQSLVYFYFRLTSGCLVFLNFFTHFRVTWDCQHETMLIKATSNKIVVWSISLIDVAFWHRSQSPSATWAPLDPANLVHSHLSFFSPFFWPATIVRHSSTHKASIKHYTPSSRWRQTHQAVHKTTKKKQHAMHPQSFMRPILTFVLLVILRHFSLPPHISHCLPRSCFLFCSHRLIIAIHLIVCALRLSRCFHLRVVALIKIYVCVRVFCILFIRDMKQIKLALTKFHISS